MAVGEIHHVDVVAYAGAIFSRVVIAKYGKRLAAANGYLRDVRHQVVWNTLRIFPHISRWMSANRVKVAQQGNAPVGLRFLQIGQDLFHHQLAFAVRTLRRAGGEAFNVRNLRLIAIDGRGGAENEVFHVSSAHCIHQTQSAVDVVVIVLQRLGNGFSNGF